MKMTLDPKLAHEAKALVALAFRNGPIEDLHAGSPCPQCSDRAEVSHISEEEMKRVIKAAVDTLYRLLWMREHNPQKYAEQFAFGQRYTLRWDDPDITNGARHKAH